MNQLRQDLRVFVTGLALGVVLLGLFVAIAFAMGLDDGFYGLPPGFWK